MAPWLFTDAIFNDRPINVFNNGDMARDFTYIDDIIDGVKKVVNSTPSIGDNNTYENSPAPHRLYNLGNNQPEQLMDFIACMENEVGKKAIKIFDDIQDGDVKETSADISSAQHDLGFKPKTSMQAGMKKFVDWFRSYHNLT
jgi:UDP-glucuronate 4-epimerase